MAGVEYSRYRGKEPIARTEHLPGSGKTVLEVGGRSIEPFHETVDFPVRNPWSSFFRETLHDLAEKGSIGNGPVTELGVGDLRNRFAFNGVPFTGIDLERSRLDVAERNRQLHDVSATLYEGDAVAFVKSKDSWDGTVIACLPQTPPAPDSVNAAVGTINEENPHLAPYAKWHDSGLQLVAAALGELSQRAEDDTKAVFLISGRVPKKIREEMITETGWKTIDVISTTKPVQQSREINIRYAEKFDAEDHEPLFFEAKDNGEFGPLTAVEAEERRHAGFEAENDPNVRHHLYAYVLEPNPERERRLYLHE